MFDLPTRSEMNSVHRQLRELKEAVNQLSATRANAPSSHTSKAKTFSAKTPRSKARGASK
jgi:hypothetical protein